MSRGTVIRRIESCVAMATSPFEQEAQAAMDRAWALIRRHQVAPPELATPVRRDLAADAVAVHLNEAGTMTRRGQLLGEAKGSWFVTGHGKVTRAKLVAIGAELGILSPWEPA